MMMTMNRIFALMLLFVVVAATDGASHIHAQHIVRTDTIVTTEVVKRTQIISQIEEVITVDTVYDSGGARGVVRHVEPPVSYQINEEETPMREVVTSSEEPIDGPAVVIPSVTPIPADGGKYLWVPDSMMSDVKTFLLGHSKLVDDESSIDHNEKVLFRGDTIPMVLRDRNLGRYNRGLFNYLYLPKGILQLGITASYGEFSTEDLEMFDLISDTDFQGKMFSIRPYFSYFIRNNMSVGLRLGYTYGRANVDSFKVDIDDDMNFDLHDIMYRSESYTAAFTFNQYFGISRRGRFAITNEVELAFSGGNSDFIRPFNNEMKQTHTTTMQAALNFSPGLSVFIIEPLTFNISFGVFGFSLKNEKQTVDGEKMGSRFTSGANFRFNIFNINFGVAVNL